MTIFALIIFLLTALLFGIVAYARNGYARFIGSEER